MQIFLVTTGNKHTLKAIKSHFKRHMINQILYLLSFHIQFIKLPKGLFNKFKYEMLTRVSSFIY